MLVGFALSLIQSTSEHTGGLIDLLWRASPIAKGVLLILLIFSLVSWAIIFSKLTSLRAAEKSSYDFISRFRRSTKLSDVYVDIDSFKACPVAQVFLAGYDEITSQIGEGGGGIRSLEGISREMQSATIEVATKLERNLSFLATTANSSPFIGLFGTVVGIVISFQALSTASASSIQAVAPGIAEALIATAAGIAAAVPAAIFYNHLLGRVKLLTATMDRFSLEMLNVVERHYMKLGL